MSTLYGTTKTSSLWFPRVGYDATFKARGFRTWTVYLFVIVVCRCLAHVFSVDTFANARTRSSLSSKSCGDASRPPRGTTIVVSSRQPCKECGHGKTNDRTKRGGTYSRGRPNKRVKAVMVSHLTTPYVTSVRCCTVTAAMHKMVRALFSFFWYLAVSCWGCKTKKKSSVPFNPCQSSHVSTTAAPLPASPDTRRTPRPADRARGACARTGP